MVDSSGVIWLGTLDKGLWRYDGSSWIEEGGPVDIVDMDWSDNGLVVGSGTTGLWWLFAGLWRNAGLSPIAGVGPTQSVTESGNLLIWNEQGVVSDAGTIGDATVHVALSFHTNLYHSYRGNTNDHDGYGIDLEVIEATLDWLDAHPDVHGDWDIENHFTLDGWLSTDGAEHLDRIQDRVNRGQDGMRLMSWNNGAMANHTRPEFEEAITRAQDSFDLTFLDWDPGVQPQENMFTPEHVGWYSSLGVEWITLFYSANPFTGLRPERELTFEQAYSPVTMTEGEDSLTLVPVYHHGDLIDHGGLLGWVNQLHEGSQGDRLLVIHFDADAESWTNFDQELDAIAELAFVRYTTIQDYLDTHDPVGSVEAPNDIADGTGDGFQSWAEKDVNHEFATTISQGRELASQALALAPTDLDAMAAADTAQTARLLALSTTHFGLAAPFLHPDREIDGRSLAQASWDAGAAALSSAMVAAGPMPSGELHVINHRQSEGVAWVTTQVLVEIDDFVDEYGVMVNAGATSVPVHPVLLDPGDLDAGSPATVEITFSLFMSSEETRVLTWDYDPDQVPSNPVAPAPELSFLDPPLTECGGVEAEPTRTSRQVVEGVLHTDTRTWDVPFCDGVGTAVVTLQTLDGFPGTVVDVDGVMGTASEPELAESVALTPLNCAQGAETLSWQTFGGMVRTRDVRQDTGGWNGSAIDGWASVTCGNGSTIQVSHDVNLRTSLAFLPMRTTARTDILAPLGTFWGPPPRHDSRRTGGHGAADIVVPAVGSQFHPAAPDWSGRGVHYRLLVGEDISEGTLDLFAHPPLIRVGRQPSTAQ